MIEKFNNIYLLVLHLLVTGVLGVVSYRALVAHHGMVKEFNMDESSIYISRCFGTFIASFFLIGIYMIFRPNGPEGAFIYYNLIFLLGLFLFIYDLLFYFKKIDKNITAKNSITDIGINTFTLISSIVLILGLSNKIYI